MQKGCLMFAGQLAKMPGNPHCSETPISYNNIFDPAMHMYPMLVTDHINLQCLHDVVEKNSACDSFFYGGFLKRARK